MLRILCRICRPQDSDPSSEADLRGMLCISWTRPWRRPHYLLTPKIIKKSDLKQRAFFLQNGDLLDPNGHPKNHKNRKKCLPLASFGPLPKYVSKCIDFWSRQNLENEAPAYIKHRFSLFGPTPKMSRKRPPKTSLLSTVGPPNRPKCGK